MKKLLFFLLLILPLNVFADVPASFNVDFDGGATGYFYSNSGSSWSGTIYQDYTYTNNVPDLAHTYYYKFKSVESINGTSYPLSFVDITSDNSPAYCTGGGCNVAITIPFQMIFKCDMDTYCGLKDNLTTHGGNIILNVTMIPLSDLPLYFEEYQDFVWLYNFFKNNSVEILYTDSQGRLKSSDTYYDFDNLYFQLVSNATDTYLRLYTFNGVDTYDSENNIIYGKIYNNDYYNFYSLRLLFNYPYQASAYTYNSHFIFTNFNANTTLTGVVPDFPETPSIPLQDVVNNDKIEDGTGSNFFSNFSTTDNGTISRIVTSPLNAISSMLSNSCTPISGSWRGKSFSLPCGSIFWSRSGASSLKDFLNLTAGGLLCYAIIRKLFFLINNLKDPDNDRVEVMKL